MKFLQSTDELARCHGRLASITTLLGASGKIDLTLNSTGEIAHPTLRSASGTDAAQ